MKLASRPQLYLVTALAALTMGCAGAAPTPASPAGAADRPPAQSKVLTIGVWGNVPGFGLAALTSPVGGNFRLSEIHSDGLVTADRSVRRPVGRLAEQAPSIENGGISLSPDGPMRVTFRLRKGITWHDGTPFTAQDLVFTYQLAGPGSFPHPLTNSIRRITGVEAPDEYTFVAHFRSPYYLAASLGPTEYWPLPRHILEPVYERYVASRSAEEVLQHPYWTSGYIHLGAFRITSFQPGEGYNLEAYERYYLGRPKIDSIRVVILGDENALVTNLLAGTVDVAPEWAVRADRGVELKRQWERTGDGVVHVKGAQLLNLPPQFRTGVQKEPANLDPKVRRALLHALDREAISDAVNGGNPQLAAWSILPENDPLYPVVKDGLRQYAYSLDRARALLAEAGWTPDANGVMRHSSDGRPYRTQLWSAESGAAAVAAGWRVLGIDVEEHYFTPTQIPDREFRALFPGWDWTGFDLMTQVYEPPAAPENRWQGSRSGYDNAAARALVEAFYTSITERDQAQAMRAFHEFFLTELPSLPLFHSAIYIAARKHVRAFDDLEGGGSFDPFGSHYRNAYLWDIVQS